MEFDGFESSKRLCQTHASSFSLAAKYLPEEERNASYAMYGFCRATDQILDSDSTIETKKSELNAWRGALQSAFETNTSSDPILHAFVHTCNKYNVPREWGFRLIDGLHRDLTQTNYQTFDDLYEYCFSAAAIPGLFMAYVMRAPPSALEHAIELGIAMQLTNILRDVKEDYSMGRVYLPQEEMTALGYSTQDIAAQTRNESFQKLMKYHIARANEYYSNAEKGISHLPPATRLSMRLCLVLYREILHEIERNNYDVYAQRVYVSDARKKELIAREQALASQRIAIH